MTSKLEVQKQQVISWSDPLGDIVVTDPPQGKASDRAWGALTHGLTVKLMRTVWFAGIGAKLYSLEVNCREGKEREAPKRFVAQVPGSPGKGLKCGLNILHHLYMILDLR